MSKHIDQRPLDTEPEFNRFIDAALSRRRFLQGTGAASAVAFFAANPVAKAVADTMSQSELLGFEAIPTSTTDTVNVPSGYKADVLVSWGDPLFANAPAFSQQNGADAQALQFGDNNDGMTFFPLASDRALLAVNNEYINDEYLFEHGGKNISADDARKSQAAHGVSLVELKKWMAAGT